MKSGLACVQTYVSKIHDSNSLHDQKVCNYMVESTLDSVRIKAVFKTRSKNCLRLEKLALCLKIWHYLAKKRRPLLKLGIHALGVMLSSREASVKGLPELDFATIS